MRAVGTGAGLRTTLGFVRIATCRCCTAGFGWAAAAIAAGTLVGSIGTTALGLAARTVLALVALMVFLISPFIQATQLRKLSVFASCLEGGRLASMDL